MYYQPQHSCSYMYVEERVRTQRQWGWVSLVLPQQPPFLILWISPSNLVQIQRRARKWFINKLMELFLIITHGRYISKSSNVTLYMQTFAVQIAIYILGIYKGHHHPLTLAHFHLTCRIKEQNICRVVRVNNLVITVSLQSHCSTVQSVRYVVGFKGGKGNYCSCLLCIYISKWFWGVSRQMGFSEIRSSGLNSLSLLRKWHQWLMYCIFKWCLCHSSLFFLQSLQSWRIKSN